MNGVLNVARQALIDIEVRHPTTGTRFVSNALIDTGFNGSLKLIPPFVAALGLEPSGRSPGVLLADGSRVELPTFTCLLQWFGELRQIEALAGSGAHTLIGTELLAELRLVLDYPAGIFTLERPSAPHALPTAP